MNFFLKNVLIFSIIFYPALSRAINYGSGIYGNGIYSSTDPITPTNTSNVSQNTYSSPGSTYSSNILTTTTDNNKKDIIAKTNTPKQYIYTRNLTLNSKGVDVINLQKFLVTNGYLKIPKNMTYGNFGPLTRQALIKYQLKNKIRATGIFGPLTRESINKSKK